MQFVQSKNRNFHNTSQSSLKTQNYAFLSIILSINTFFIEVVLKLCSNFLSHRFSTSFCLLFIFNLYVWGSSTQRILCIIYCIIWVESPVWISGGCAVSYFLLQLVFSFYREYILFCRRNFSFAVTYFFFATIFFLLSWHFFFWLWEFLFCREFSSFALTCFLFAVTPVGHRTFHFYQLTSK